MCSIPEGNKTDFTDHIFVDIQGRAAVDHGKYEKALKSRQQPTVENQNGLGGLPILARRHTNRLYLL
jgi:hypothetical protein